MLPPAPTRSELREHLVRTRIAGPVVTSRENNLRNLALMCERADNYDFGLELERRWLPDEVLALLADRVGVQPDPSYRMGPDTIDPERTIERLDAMSEVLVRAVRNRERVFVATGHPTGLLAIHLSLAWVLREAGCQVLDSGDGARVAAEGRSVEVRHVLGVAMIRGGGELLHTHSAEPMRVLLANGVQPELVVGDHGWAGAAGQAGIPAVGFADSNDPALFVGRLRARSR